MYDLDYRNLVTMGFSDVYYEYYKVCNAVDEVFELLNLKECVDRDRLSTQCYCNRRTYPFEEFKKNKKNSNEIVLAENQDWIGIVIKHVAQDAVSNSIVCSNGKPVFILNKMNQLIRIH